MLQSTTLDSRTVIIRADKESDILDLFIYLKQKAKDNKQHLLNRFLDFAKDNYTSDPSFKFNREDYYDFDCCNSIGSRM
jgi:pantothenate kinase